MVNLYGIEVSDIDTIYLVILQQCNDNWMKWIISFDLCLNVVLRWFFVRLSNTGCIFGLFAWGL